MALSSLLIAFVVSTATCAVADYSSSQFPALKNTADAVARSQHIVAFSTGSQHNAVSISTGSQHTAFSQQNAAGDSAVAFSQQHTAFAGDSAVAFSKNHAALSSINHQNPMALRASSNARRVFKLSRSVEIN